MPKRVLCAGDALRIQTKASLQTNCTSWDMSTLRSPGTSIAWASLRNDVDAFRGH
jgi:hypothetical protein